MTNLMDDFQFGEALRQIHDFLWGEFCDWYIELAKIRLQPTAEEVVSPIPVLIHVLETSLRLLHPYMPFVTEELWQHLKKRLPADWQATDSIMVAAYPEADTKAVDPKAERVMESIIEIIRSIRNARAEHKVESARWIEAQIYGGQLTPAEKQRLQKEIEQSQAEVTRLEARLSDKAFLSKAPKAVVDKEQDRLTERKDKLERLRQQLDRFS